jgi:hypothetical protein
MTSLKVEEGKATLYLALKAEYTNDETEELLSTRTVRVLRDHPLISALVDIWHGDGDRRWADNPAENPEVRMFLNWMRAVLDSFFAEGP